MGTFGPVTVRVPRARLEAPDGKTAEWKNATIPAYQRRTKQADALIAGAYLSGTNTRRVRRALAACLAVPVARIRQEIVIDIVEQAFDVEFDNPIKLPAPAFGDGDRVMR
jgi:transposase-like protein